MHREEVAAAYEALAVTDRRRFRRWRCRPWVGVSTDDPDARAAAEGFSSQGYTYAGERAGRTPTVIYRSSG